jgi:hypothetical protein
MNFKNIRHARYWWPKPVILSTWEAEIESIKAQSQLKQIV